MQIPIKIDKNVWMNFLHTFVGGIFGGLIVAFALGQPFPKWDMEFYLIFMAAIVIVGILGVLLMGWVNYWWEKSKGRIPKNKKS